MSPLYIYSSSIGAIICIALGLLVLIKNKTHPANRSFSLLLVSIGVWTLFPYISGTVENESRALFWSRLVYLAAIFTPLNFLRAISIVLGREREKRTRTMTKISVATSLMLCLFSLGGFFIKGLQRFKPNFYVDPGPLYILFILYFGFICLYTFANLFNGIRKAQGLKRNQLRYVIAGFLIAFMGGVIHVMAPYINLEYIPHDIFIITFAFVISYAIAVLKLMEINIVLRKAITNLMWASVISVTILCIAYSELHPLLKSVLGIAGSFLIVLYIPKLKLKTEETIHQLLYKDKYSYQGKLRDFIETMVFIPEEKELLEKVSEKLTGLMEVKGVSIYLKNHAENPLFTKIAEIEPWLKTDQEIFIREEHPEVEFDPKINIVVPIAIQEEMLGLITLSEKTTGEMYTHLDLALLKRLGTQLAIVLNYKKMEQRLREHEATKQLVRMAMELSHQFHSRLVSVQTHFMVMAQKNGNDPERKEFEELSKLAIEDMNAIFHKLRELTFFAQLDHPKPRDTGIEKIIEGAITLQREKLKKKNIILERIEESSLPKLFIDEELITSALSNILENAIWAVAEKNGKITFSATRLQNTTPEMLVKSKEWISITLSDNGQGISEAILKKAFDAFYTTRNMGEEGQKSGFGLGLTITQRIIEAHGGMINIKSKKGETLIRLDLPVKYDRDLTETQKLLTQKKGRT